MKKDSRWYAAAAALCAAILVAGGINFSVARQQAQQASSDGRNTFCTLDASGFCTVQHGLGYTPDGVVVTSERIGQLGTTDQFTSTSFRVRWWWYEPTANGNLFTPGTRIDFSWVPGRGPSATTPPPTSTTPTTTPTSPPTTPPTTPPEPGTSPVLACTSPTFTTIATDNNGDGRTVQGPGGPYFIHNNMWNNHSGAGPTGTYRMDMCTPYDNWKETWRQQPSTVSPGAVRAYPNIHKDYADIPVSSVFSTRFAHNTTKVAGHVWNVAFDSWITCNGNDFGGELMIWTENHNQTPAGSRLPGTTTIGGQAYEVWKTGGASSMCGIFTYRSVNTQTHGTMPLQEFYTDLKNRGWIAQNATTWQVDYGIETVSTAGVDLVTNFNDFEMFDVTNPGNVAESNRTQLAETYETVHPPKRNADARAWQKAHGLRR